MRDFTCHEAVKGREARNQYMAGTHFSSTRFPSRNLGLLRIVKKDNREEKTIVRKKRERIKSNDTSRLEQQW